MSAEQLWDRVIAGPAHPWRGPNGDSDGYPEAEAASLYRWHLRTGEPLSSLRALIHVSRAQVAWVRWAMREDTAGLRACERAFAYRRLVAVAFEREVARGKAR